MLKFVFASLLAVSFSFAATIKDVMKNELKPAFKIVVDSARKGEITAETKAAGVKLEASFMSIKDQVPEFIPKNGDVVKPTPEDIAKYKTLMNDMVILCKQLNEALAANSVPALQKVADQMHKHARASHDLFKGE